MPAAKPVSQHKAAGTYRQDRHGKRAKVERKGRADLRVPSTLPAKWRPLWHKVIATLEPSWLESADGWQLAGLVTALGIQADAAAELASTGTVVRNASGHDVRNPYFGIWRGATETIRTLSSKLGLSPLDRVRLLAGLDIDDTGDAGELFAEMMQAVQNARQTDAAPVIADEW